jgi:hypothetical protein
MCQSSFSTTPRTPCMFPRVRHMHQSGRRRACRVALILEGTPIPRQAPAEEVILLVRGIIGAHQSDPAGSGGTNHADT